MRQTLILEWQLNDTRGSYLLREGHVALIGRQPDCDVVVTTPTVSRDHAVVFLSDGALWLRNLSRTNPVHLGSRRLASGETARLLPGETFRLGGVTFHVREERVADSCGSTDPELPVSPDGSTPAEGGVRLRCARCKNVLDYDRRGFCPHCGLARMNAETFVS